MALRFKYYFLKQCLDDKCRHIFISVLITHNKNHVAIKSLYSVGVTFYDVLLKEKEKELK